MTTRLAPILILSILTALPSARAVLVGLDTPIGTMRFELFDDKPETTSNFLAYINSGRYTGSFAHRLVQGFVLQSGGFNLDGNMITEVETFAPIVNEYPVGTIRSNTFGTLAMAKLGGDPDSATSQWFVNLANNGPILDGQNGGFTVFGQIVDGEEVLQIILDTFTDPEREDGRGIYNASGDFGPAFEELPLVQYDPNLALTTNDLFYTDFYIIPEPPIAALGFFAAGVWVALAISRRRVSIS